MTLLKHDFRHKENSVQQYYKRALTAHAEEQQQSDHTTDKTSKTEKQSRKQICNKRILITHIT